MSAITVPSGRNYQPEQKTRGRILLVHNHYRQPGGEEIVFQEEGELLAAHGHEVFRFEDHNERATRMSRMGLGLATVWNAASARRLSKFIARVEPEIVHFHNTFPLISPSAYYPVRRSRIPVVQTVHNYRMLCLNGLFFRDGKPCESCLEKGSVLPGVIHRCYRNSVSASMTVASMLAIHQTIGTWRDQVDAFIAPSEYVRQKLVLSGFPNSKVFMKPHFLGSDPGMGNGEGSYFLFVGRLAEEKGLKVLIDAWRLSGSTLPLRIVGDGPLAFWLREQAARLPKIEILGALSHGEVLAQMKDARALVFPSACYESAGRVVIEAFASGVPVIASDHGPMVDSVQQDWTGRRFRTEDAAALASEIRFVLENGPHWLEMKHHARMEFERRYTKQANFRMLTEIYRDARELAKCN